MSADDAYARFAWRDAFFVALILLGTVCLALSLFWPTISTGGSRWSGEKAAAYQSAAARLHELSMTAASTSSEKQSRALRNELAEAQSKYARLRGELDTARESPARIATVLRYSGLLIACVGIAGFIAKRANA